MFGENGSPQYVPVTASVFAGAATVYRIPNNKIAPFPAGKTLPQVAFEVSGFSMIGDGIEDGDTVFVRTDLNPKSNSLVVIQSPDGPQLKRVRPTGSGTVCLLSSNPETREIYVDADDVSLVGVVVGVFKPIG